jgi:hypothetical protein
MRNIGNVNNTDGQDYGSTGDYLGGKALDRRSSSPM